MVIRCWYAGPLSDVLTSGIVGFEFLPTNGTMSHLSVAIPENMLPNITDSSEASAWVCDWVVEMKGTGKRQVFVVVGGR